MTERSQKELMRLERVKFIWTLGVLLGFIVVVIGVFSGIIAAGRVTGVDPTAGAIRGIGGFIVTSPYLCAGLPILVLSLLMRWRADSAMRREERHAEELDAMRGKE